jgi:hypothetical protein
VEVFNPYISRRITSQECLSEIILTRQDLVGPVGEICEVTRSSQAQRLANLLLIFKVTLDM